MKFISALGCLQVFDKEKLFYASYQGYLGPIQKFGPEYRCSEIRYLHESLIER